LHRSFGHSPSIQFEVYPPRTIVADALPSFSAVLLSHEHIDHFHLPSLALLPRTVRVIVGELMSACVVDSIAKLGFRVERKPFLMPFNIGDLTFTFYPAACSTIFWEKRVCQLLVTPIDSSVEQLFVAVDALISDSFREDVKSGKIKLRAVFCTNNSQVVPPGACYIL
jgi:hypothetical protein